MTLNDFIKILLGNQFSQFDFLEKANVDEFDMFYTSPCLFSLVLLKLKHLT